MPENDRLHALDAVRGFALLLGIVLHATMSFILPIPALDSSQSTTLAIVFFVIHIFRMSLFYLIAGFFARLVIVRRGGGEFLRNRAKRILVPFVGGWVVLFPLTLLAIAWGVSRTAANIEAAGFADLTEQSSGGFPLLHLWFLYYLMLFYLIAVAIHRLVGMLIKQQGRLTAAVDRVCFRGLASYLGPVVLSLPIAFVVLQHPQWIPFTGIPTPDSGFTPQLPATIAYGIAFLVGWIAHRQIGLLAEWKSRWRINISIALVVTVIALLMVPVIPDWSVRSAPGSVQSYGVAYAICYGAAIWYWSFGILGLALEFMSTASGWRRYLADSSYWLYLVHLPLIFFLQALVSTWPLHWSIKYPGVLVVAMAILLASYHYLVRPTWIGDLLNGRRYLREPGR